MISVMSQILTFITKNVDPLRLLLYIYCTSYIYIQYNILTTMEITTKLWYQPNPTPFFQLPMYCIFLHHIRIRRYTQYWKTLFSKIIKHIQHINCNNIWLNCSTTEPSTSAKIKTILKVFLKILFWCWLHPNQPRTDWDTPFKSLEWGQKSHPAHCLVPIASLWGQQA